MFEPLENKDAEHPFGRAERGARRYLAANNARSVDGLPGLYLAEKDAEELGIDPNAMKPFVVGHGKGRVFALISKEWAAFDFKSAIVGAILGVLVVLVAFHYDLLSQPGAL